MKRLSINLAFLAALALSGAELALSEDEQLIRITLRGKPVLEYVKTEKPVPQGLAAHYRRSGYIHPVYSPTGQEISGDFPLDHAHQHALFFAWRQTRFDGKKVDFWNLASEQGTVEHRGVTAIDRQDDEVSFTVKHTFVALSGDTRTDVLHESWRVTVHLTPEDYFLFDIESVQECATDKALVIEKYHYGGMAIRGNTEWLNEKKARSIGPGDLRMLTSEGKDRWAGNHTRPNWVA
ncbi:MAG: hypothetical protein ACI8W8_005023, partial [Rhodothermales bacterium]